MGKRERSFLNRSVLDDIIFLGTSKLMYRAFELLKVGLFKFPPLGGKKPFKYPTN